MDERAVKRTLLPCVRNKFKVPTRQHLWASVGDADKVLVVDFSTGDLLRLNLRKLTVDKIARGFGAVTALSGALSGRKVWKLDLRTPGAKPKHYNRSFQAAAPSSANKA